MFEVSHNHHVKQSFVDSLQNRTVDRFRVLNAMVSSCQFHSEEGNLEVSKQAMEEAAPRPQKCNQEIPGKGVDCNLEFIDFLRGVFDFDPCPYRNGRDVFGSVKAHEHPRTKLQMDGRRIFLDLFIVSG